MQLVTQATRTLRLVAPFIDRTGLSFLADALAAATARRVRSRSSCRLGPRMRAPPSAIWSGSSERDGDVGRSRVPALRHDAPWAHLKVLASDSDAAYIGSANVTGPGSPAPISNWDPRPRTDGRSRRACSTSSGRDNRAVSAGPETDHSSALIRGSFRHRPTRDCAMASVAQSYRIKALSLAAASWFDSSTKFKHTPKSICGRLAAPDWANLVAWIERRSPQVDPANRGLARTPSVGIWSRHDQWSGCQA